MDEAPGVAPSGAHIAGLWRRLFAFCIDGLLLGALGGCVGLVAFDRLVALGDWGRAVGFAIALIYFGAMDGGLFGGQTLGKRALGIKVATGNGLPLGTGASTLRAAIFCVPYFLNGAFISSGAITSWLSVLQVVMVFGVGISIGYLLLFNRRTRQSLHDLAVGAYVVSSKAGGPVSDGGRLWIGHLSMIGLILLAAAALPYLGQRVARSARFVDLLSVQQGLQQEPDVRHATVNIGINTFSSKNQDTTTTHVFSSRIFLSRRVADLDSLANNSARIILDRDPAAEREDLIAISIVYGYDIGIASAWRSHDFSFSPGQWRKRFASI
jgi:uncharacterized RDD family membrane protein YckC